MLDSPTLNPVRLNSVSEGQSDSDVVVVTAGGSVEFQVAKFEL